MLHSFYGVKVDAGVINMLGIHFGRLAILPINCGLTEEDVEAVSVFTQTKQTKICLHGSGITALHLTLTLHV